MPPQKSRPTLKKEPLSVTHPQLVADWHATKNGDLRAENVTAGSTKKVWWQCKSGHEWQATVGNRTLGRGCPYCANRKVDQSNCLAATHPQLVSEWHSTRNGDLRPEHVTGTSGRKIWWKCAAAEDHEWEATLQSRGKGVGCPYCSGNRAVKSNCLATTDPELAKEWHPTKNAELTPNCVTRGSGTKVWWKCPVADDHEWEAQVVSRTHMGSGCPCCEGLKAVKSNCLATTHPDLARQWHPTRNGSLTPGDVVPGSSKKVWWKCSVVCDHEWQATINSRTRLGTGCSCCAGLTVVTSICLATTHPEIAKEWHPTKNGDLTPEDVMAGSYRKVWWKCAKGPDHEWQAKVEQRARLSSGCPFCCNRLAAKSNCLSFTQPELAKEWHPTKNGDLRPENVTAGSDRTVWWKCPHGDRHEWEAPVYSRSSGVGCPFCGRGWTSQNIRLFVASLKDHLHAFTPAELYLLFLHNGLLQSQGRGITFAKALATGRFPQREVEKFVNAELSLVDQFFQDPSQTLEALETNEPKKEGAQSAVSDLDEAIVEQVEEGREKQLPVVETNDILSSLGLQVVSSADDEAIEFLLASAIRN